MRESVIEDDNVAYAESKGWLVRKAVYAGRRGSPDRWFMRRRRNGDGHLFHIEFKKPGEKPDGLQQKEHDRLRGAGFRVYVIDNIATGRKAIDDETERANAA